MPFTFPAYVVPAGKKIPKREKIKLNVNSAINQEIECKCTSHPIKVWTFFITSDFHSGSEYTLDLIRVLL